MILITDEFEVSNSFGLIYRNSTPFRKADSITDFGYCVRDPPNSSAP
jgi:hypothetical protein